MNVFDGLGLPATILLVFALVALAALAAVGAIETAFWLMIRRRRKHIARHR